MNLQFAIEMINQDFEHSVQYRFCSIGPKLLLPQYSNYIEHNEYFHLGCYLFFFLWLQRVSTIVHAAIYFTFAHQIFDLDLQQFPWCALFNNFCRSSSSIVNADISISWGCINMFRLLINIQHWYGRCLDDSCITTSFSGAKSDPRWI